MPKPKPSSRRAVMPSAVRAPPSIADRLYAGLDVGEDRTWVCIKAKDKSIVWEGFAPSTVAGLDQALAPYLTRLAKVGFEATMFLQYLFNGLKDRGYTVVCIDAWSAHGLLRTKAIKSDRNDARGLADLLCSEAAIVEVVPRSMPDMQLRSLLASRKGLVEVSVGLRNMLRSQRRLYGEVMSNAAVHRLTPSALGHGIDAEGSKAVLKVLAETEARIAGLDKVLVKIARLDPRCNLLLTIPGVGPTTALAYVSAVGDVARFRSSRSVGAYLGLVPGRYASGKTSYNLRISKRGDGLARVYLFTAAHSLLQSGDQASALVRWGQAQAKRRGNTHARVALARRLAVIMHRMLMTGERFRPEVLEAPGSISAIAHDRSAERAHA